MVTFVHSPACIHYSLSYTPSPRTARRTAHRLQSTASTGDNKAATGNTAAERRGTARSAFDDPGIDYDLSILLELHIWTSPVSHCAGRAVYKCVFRKCVVFPDAIFAN